MYKLIIGATLFVSPLSYAQEVSIGIGSADLSAEVSSQIKAQAEAYVVSQVGGEGTGSMSCNLNEDLELIWCSLSYNGGSTSGLSLVQTRLNGEQFSILKEAGSKKYTCTTSEDSDQFYTLDFEVGIADSNALLNYTLNLRDSLVGNPVAFSDEKANADSDYKPTPRFKGHNRFWLSTEIDGQYRVIVPRELSSSSFDVVLRLNHGPEEEFSQFSLNCVPAQ